MQSRAPAVSMDLTSYELGHFPKMYEGGYLYVENAIICFLLCLWR